MAQQNLSAGQTIIFQTNLYNLKGKIKVVGKDFVEISDVYDFNLDHHFPKSFIFKLTNIKAYEILYTDEMEPGTSFGAIKNDTNKQNALPSLASELKQVKIGANDPSATKPSNNSKTYGYTFTKMETELKRLQKLQKQVKNQLHNVRYITESDNVYEQAVEYVDSYPVVGFDCVTQYVKGSLKTAFFIFSTCRMVYIFDLIAIGGRVPQKLANILTSVWPQKVVYDKDRLDDYLTKHHQIKLNFAFDILVAYKKLSNREDNLSLMELVMIVCNIKLGDDDNEFPIAYQQLTQHTEQKYAKKAILLLKVYENLTHKFFQPLMEEQEPEEPEPEEPEPEEPEPEDPEPKKTTTEEPESEEPEPKDPGDIKTQELSSDSDEGNYDDDSDEYAQSVYGPKFED